MEFGINKKSQTLVDQQLETLKKEGTNEVRKAIKRVEFACGIGVGKKMTAGGLGLTKGGAGDSNVAEKRRALSKVLSLLVQATFTTLSDEEHVMRKYNIAPIHRKTHAASHTAFLKQLQTAVLQIVRVLRQDMKNTGEDVDVVWAKYAQRLSQVYISWLTEHVQKIDREMVPLLAGKAPESEMERDIRLDVFRIPASYQEFLEGDNATMQEKALFQRMVKALKLTIRGKPLAI